MNFQEAMEKPRAVSTGKKLVQARLPFQVFRSPKDVEPRKKLEYTAPMGDDTDDFENRQNINTIPVVSISDGESSPLKSVSEELNGISPMDCSDVSVEQVRKNKRGNLEEFSSDKIAKKIKLDTKSKLSKFANLSKSQSEQPMTCSENSSKNADSEKCGDTAAASTDDTAEKEQNSKRELPEACDAALKEDTKEEPVAPILEEETKTVDDVEVVDLNSEEEGDGTDENEKLDKSCEEASEKVDDGSTSKEKEKASPTSKTKERKRTPKQKGKQEEAAKRREEKERLKQVPISSIF